MADNKESNKDIRVPSRVNTYSSFLPFKRAGESPRYQREKLFQELKSFLILRDVFEFYGSWLFFLYPLHTCPLTFRHVVIHFIIQLQLELC